MYKYSLYITSISLYIVYYNIFFISKHLKFLNVY